MKNTNNTKERMLETQKQQGIKVQSVALPNDFFEKPRDKDNFMDWAKTIVKSRYLNAF